MGAALHILYAGFLIAAFILGMFAANLSGTTSEISANVNNEKVKLMDSNSSEILGHPLSYQCKFPLNVCDELSILYVSLGLGFLAMLIIFLLFDQVRSNNGEIINRIIVLRKRELDDLKGDPINQSQRDEKALQAEREIYRVLTNRIGPYRLWKLSRMSDQKFLRKIESLI